jgi:hypothetical protein
MLKYRRYLAGKGEPSSSEDVKKWIKQMFAGELASLDEMIDGDELGKNDCLQLINFYSFFIYLNLIISFSFLIIPQFIHHTDLLMRPTR